jgi:membrane-associated phospholipid phosphatase
MKRNKLLFWQPLKDILKLLNQSRLGQILVIFLNYSIWGYFFYLSFLLIRHQTNTFWQLLIATITAELIEKFGKSHCLWRRPMYERHDPTPVGLVDRWYKTGSFPSGHTMKAAYFLLFILQYQVHDLRAFLTIVIPLIFFRVLVGFHYPIDIYAGSVIGMVVWYLTKSIVFPPALTEFVRVIFNFVFLIK